MEDPQVLTHQEIDGFALIAQEFSPPAFGLGQRYAIRVQEILDHLGARGLARASLKRLAFLHRPVEAESGLGYVCQHCQVSYPCMSLKTIKTVGWNDLYTEGKEL